MLWLGRLYEALHVTLNKLQWYHQTNDFMQSLWSNVLRTLFIVFCGKIVSMMLCIQYKGGQQILAVWRCLNNIIRNCSVNFGGDWAFRFMNVTDFYQILLRSSLRKCKVWLQNRVLFWGPLLWCGRTIFFVIANERRLLAIKISYTHSRAHG